MPQPCIQWTSYPLAECDLHWGYKRALSIGSPAITHHIKHDGARAPPMAAATDMHIFYNVHSTGFECPLEKYCKRRKDLLVLVATIVDNHVKPTLSFFYPAFECRHVGLVTSDSIYGKRVEARFMERHTISVRFREPELCVW